jgi:predicted transcriptional regulator
MKWYSYKQYNHIGYKSVSSKNEFLKMNLDDDDDNESFMSGSKDCGINGNIPSNQNVLVSAGVRATTSIPRKGMIFSIPSSSDEDDDDIATLRASPSYIDSSVIDNNNDDDRATNEEKHATQELVRPTPWSPLTASPYTPNCILDGPSASSSRGKVLRSHKIDQSAASATATSISPSRLGLSNDDNAATAKSIRRQGLNLSKVPPSSRSDCGVVEISSSTTTSKTFTAVATCTKKANKISMEPICHVSDIVIVPKRSPRRMQDVPINTSDNHSDKQPSQCNVSVSISTAVTSKSVLEAVSTMTESPNILNSKGTKRMKRSSSADGDTHTVTKQKAASVPKDANSDQVLTKQKIKEGKATKTAPAVSVKTDKKILAKETVTDHSDEKSKKKKACVESNVNGSTQPKLKRLKAECQPITDVNATANSTANVVINNESSHDAIKEGTSNSANTSNTEIKTSITKKNKKLTFQEQVMAHMLNTFKPFTLKSLADEIKSNETSINFVLLSLIDKGLVLQKDFTSSKGRTKTLFWANYNGKAKEVQVSSMSVSERLICQEERETAQRRMVELRTHVASIRQRYQHVLQTPSNHDLTDQILIEEHALQELYQRRDDVNTRIRATKLHASKVSQTRQKLSSIPKTALQLTKERCPIRLKQRINHLRKEWKVRKDKCTDFVEQLADGLEKKPKDVLGLLDIDTDEMNHVVMPAKYNVA